MKKTLIFEKNKKGALFCETSPAFESGVQHGGAGGVVHGICSEERGQVHPLLVPGPQASQGVLVYCCFLCGPFFLFENWMVNILHVA